MNPYLQRLNKIEFVVTLACTGRCKHCSEGEHTLRGEAIDPQIAAKAVRETAEIADLQTVMTFGGEPLLYPDTVYAIMRAAEDLRISRRQVITNGYFSRDAAKIEAVAADLAACGVNDLLLSVDAFHQEFIPLEPVLTFAGALKRCGVPTRLSPAWLVGPDDSNPYNRETRRLLVRFEALGIPVGEGNVIFPEGNALRHLASYFGKTPPPNPYEEDPYDLRCLSVLPNGDLLGGNLYRQSLSEILEGYTP